MQRIQQRMQERTDKNAKIQQLKLISDALHELQSIQCEVRLANEDHSLESIFYTHGKHAMLSARFYHECMLLNIPCVLDVKTQFGEVDAIIEMEEKFIIVEFKSVSKLIEDGQTRSQIKRYLKHQYPVILIYQAEFIARLLHALKRKKLKKEAYLYENGSFQHYKLSTDFVDNDTIA